MKFELNKTWHLLFYLVGGFIVISILAFLFIALMYRLNDFWLFSWIIPNGAESAIPTATPTNSAETIRNFAWLFWMFLSLSGAGLGLWLAWRGRQIQQEQLETQNKSHLQERQEGLRNAADMLSSEIELMRITACRSLMNLATSEESLKSACARLLFDFINSPYLEADDKGKSLDELFPVSKLLRPDIQTAIDSFSAIYGYYGDAGIDNEEIKLPLYFWKNRKKKSVSLVKANLRGANLERAYLNRVNLGKANLHRVNLRKASLWGSSLQHANLRIANLREASLWGANLQDADLRSANLCEANLRGAKLQGTNLQNTDLQDADVSEADLRKVKNLARNQILSAKWGYSRYSMRRHKGTPQLPEDLTQDEDIKKWLEAPAYDNRDPKDS